MAKTIEQYRNYIDMMGFTYLMAEAGGDIDDLLDNIIDYDGIVFPDEGDTEPIQYQLLETRAWAAQGEEYRKVVIALREYIQETIMEPRLSEQVFMRNAEEAGL